MSKFYCTYRNNAAIPKNSKTENKNRRRKKWKRKKETEYYYYYSLQQNKQKQQQQKQHIKDPASQEEIRSSNCFKASAGRV